MWVVHSSVEDCRRFHECEGCSEQLNAWSKVGVGHGKLAVQSLSLGREVMQPLAYLAGGDRTASRKVEKVLLLHVEFRQLRSELVMAQPRGFLAVSDDLCQLIAHRRDERRLEMTFPDEPFDGCFDDIKRYVPFGAVALLLSCAEEVEVLAAVADGPVVDEAVVVAVSLASSAPQGAPQVVGVDPSALIYDASFVKNDLHSCE